MDQLNSSGLGQSYLEYPHRSYGMDHDRYDWSMLTDRKPLVWPGGKRLAVWVNVGLQFFPLNQEGIPFKVPGGMTMPYPDLRHYTLRDYGNRVGIYRFFKAFDRYGIKPSIAMNARLAERHPQLVRAVRDRGYEIICHGLHMDALHYGGMDPEQEKRQVSQSLETLRQITGQSVRGWLSPAKNQSGLTPEILADHGIEYLCDWVNDELPYEFRTANGSLTAMPLSTELEDRFVLMNNLHTEQSWLEQVQDACEYLLTESKEQGGRMLSLAIHPWLLGQPHRIGVLEEALAYVSRQDSVWLASSGEIVDSYRSQVGL